MPKNSLTPLGLFREEAVEHYLKEVEGRGILKVSPPWTWLLFWTLGGLVALALVFSIVGKVEVNDHGKGILRPKDGVRMLLAPTSGVVVEQPARPGDYVKQGQPLMRLESPELQGSLLQSQREVDLLHSDYRSVAAEQDALFQKQTANYPDKIAALQADIKSYEHAVDTEAEQLKNTQYLFSQGISSNLDVKKQQGNLESAQRQLRAGNQQLKQAKEDWASIQATHQQQLYSRKSDLSGAETKREALDYNLRQNLITAPVDGYVDGMVVHAGDRVQAGQAVGKLVPAQAELHIVSFLPEKDRAHVHEGDAVRVELSGYPYAEYGTLAGHVKRIGEDLASTSEWQEAMGDSEHPDGPTFRVELSVEQPKPNPLRQPVKLRPGMLLNVRYTLQRQSLITMAIEPLKRWLR